MSRIFSLRQRLAKIDMLGSPVPGFNIKGKDTIYTTCGGLLSVCIYTIIICFAAMKYMHLELRKNPSISQVVQQNVYTAEDIFDPVTENFKLAFTFERYYGKTTINDPKYTKMFVRTYGIEDGVFFEKEVPFKKCEESDYKEFYPVQKDSELLLNELKSDPNRGLYCIDMEEQKVNFIGNERTNDYQMFEIFLLPCNHKLTHLGGTDDRIPDECIPDLEK